MTVRPDFLAELKEALARGDKEGANEVRRRQRAWNTANARPRSADPSGDLKKARTRDDVAEAEAVIRDALEQRLAHTLTPDDLIWVVSKVGAWKSSWKAGQAIAAWLRHHGPIDRPLLDVAKEIAAEDNAEWLDDVLLWIDPTPDRWCQHACWQVMLASWRLADELKKLGREMPTTISDPEDVALYKSCVVAHFSDLARWVLKERGESAFRALRAAPERAEPDSEARLVLDAWAEGVR